MSGFYLQVMSASYFGEIAELLFVKSGFGLGKGSAFRRGEMFEVLGVASGLIRRAAFGDGGSVRGCSTSCLGGSDGHPIPELSEFLVATFAISCLGEAGWLCLALGSNTNSRLEVSEVLLVALDAFGAGLPESRAPPSWTLFSNAVLP